MFRLDQLLSLLKNEPRMQDADELFSALHPTMTSDHVPLVASSWPVLDPQHSCDNSIHGFGYSACLAGSHHGRQVLIILRRNRGG